jgi:hypothetical protein
MHSDGKDFLSGWGRRAADRSDAGEIADDAVALWRGMGVVLSPIIGQGGMSALYQRSVYLTRIDHPCLQSVLDLATTQNDFATLHAALAQVSGPEAATAASALFGTFHSLLAHLIGESLTERLLRSVWINPSSGEAVQDNAS